MIISPFTPLFFDRARGDRNASVYTQVFAKEDPIFIECLCAPEEAPDFRIARVGDPRELWRPFVMHRHVVNESVVLWHTIIRRLENGVFRLIDETHGYESNPFRVSDKEEDIRNTALIQYSMGDNTRRDDARFVINGQRRFFSLRVPGGFKDNDWTFSVDTEQFTDPHGDIHTLYSQESVQKKFTLGCADGVPVCFAELLNRLLTCTYVYIDGVRYTRVGSSVPEASELSGEVDSYVYKVNLQRVMKIDPKIENENILSIRRDYTDVYRTAKIEDTNHNILTE